MIPPRASKLEAATLLHLALLGVFCTWAFGGGAPWAVTALCLLGSLAPALTVATLWKKQPSERGRFRPLLWLLPLVGFNALVLLGTHHPSLRVLPVEGIQVFAPVADLPPGPSSARPDLALRALWLFDAIVLSSFNLFVAVRRRRTLRTLLFILTANALALAVFGSIQKFVQAPGLFFGEVASPNPTFFASFIYHNHWGAYVVLMLAVCLGLLFSIEPWKGHRDFWHSPALAAVVAVFFLAVTIPLSGSRSCTALAVVLLAAALIHSLRRLTRHRRAQGKSAAAPTVWLGLTVTIAATLIFILARESIDTRVADTQAQFAHMQSIGGLGARSQLYGDTWRMAADRPWFGWGLGAYGTVFTFYNTQHAIDNLPQFYQHAHSDWLQLFAETGLIGLLLFLRLLWLPLPSLRDLRTSSPTPRYLLLGCGLILLYAGIEFPFGNPAVTLLFWTCFFCAVRWMQLDRRATAA